MTDTSITHRSGTLQSTQLDYFLIDGSGSMSAKWYDSMAALDGFTDVLKSQNISSHGIVNVFDSTDLHLVQRDGLISDWIKFSEEPLAAYWGGTPLYDAINLMGRELRDLKPARCSIVIVTDGEENGSKHTTPAQAKAILDWCRAQGWQVTFLGCDFNNNKQAKMLGASESNSLGVQATRMIEAGKVLGAKRVKNALYGDDINFTSDEKKDFGGYLTDGSNGK